MENDWILIKTYFNSNEAHVVKGLLQEHHIQAVLLNKQDSSYGVFGQLELYCHLNQAAQAIDILENLNDE
jgi:hypothetical protein